MYVYISWQRRDGRLFGKMAFNLKVNDKGVVGVKYKSFIDNSSCHSPFLFKKYKNTN